MIPLTLPDARGLQHPIVRRRLPKSENYRNYYGRALDLGRIENAITAAQGGMMVPLCDLESEALAHDPHLQGLCGKRFGAVQTQGWMLEQAKGPDVDEREARLMLETTRAKIAAIPSFSERLYDLAWGLFDGRSACEIHWYLRRGTRFPWSIAGLEWLHPRRLSFNQARELLIVDTFHATGDFEAVGIPLEQIPGKFVHWKPRLFREYQEREGLAPRTMYWAFFKRFSQRHRMTLTEIFALPWRIVKASKDTPVQGDWMARAKEEAEALGSETVGAFAAGIDVDVVFPHENSGNLFHMNEEDIDRQMSKLVLGNTGTTDGSEANRANSVVQKGEQDILTIRDAEGLSGRIQQDLVLPMCALDFGQDALINAPRFKIVSDPPRDRDKDLAAAKTIVDMGAPVALDELYERAQMRRPERNEAVIVKEDTGAVDAFGSPLPPGARVRDPARDLDDVARKAAELEDGGVERAKKNAEEDIAELRRLQRADEITISNNHGHTLMGAIGAAGVYPLAGDADHTHAVEITEGQLEALERGVPIIVSSSPAEDGHAHELGIMPIGKVDAGARDLLKSAGVTFTADAMRYLSRMPEATQRRIVETLVGERR